MKQGASSGRVALQYSMLMVAGLQNEPLPSNASEAESLLLDASMSQFGYSVLILTFSQGITGAIKGIKASWYNWTSVSICFVWYRVLIRMWIYFERCIKMVYHFNCYKKINTCIKNSILSKPKQRLWSLYITSISFLSDPYVYTSDIYHLPGSAEQHMLIFTFFNSGAS